MSQEANGPVPTMEIRRILPDGRHATVTVGGERREGQAERIYPSGSVPSIGLVIGTYGSVPYVHLLLEAGRRLWPDVPVLVHDDLSPAGAELRELCSLYGADFETNTVRRGHTIGDLSAFYGGFIWARERGLDLLVKMSRRFVPLFDWREGLRELAAKTQYATFSNVCMNLNWGFRTECVAMHVNSWHAAGAVEAIGEEVATKTTTFCEGFIHQRAQQVIARASCVANDDYRKRHPKGDWCKGHGDWSLLGTNRVVKQNGLLWHHACEPREYCEVSRGWGLPYQVDDFGLTEHRQQPSSPLLRPEQAKAELRHGGPWFAHSGDLGDVIYALPTIRALGGGTLYLFHTPGLTTHRMSADRAASLRTLLIRQPYIRDVVYCPEGHEDHALNQFREHLGNGKNLADVHLATHGLGPEHRFERWLTVDDPLEVAPVIINRTERFPGRHFPWKDVVRKYARKAAFVGTIREWELFVREFGHVPYHPTPTLLELARTIAGSQLFVGNQSCAEAIAEGMKHPKVLEVAVAAGDSCIFRRLGACYAHGQTLELPDV